MGTLTEQQLQPLIDQISKREDIFEPTVEYKYANDAGSGYMGVINAIEVKGKNKSIDLIVKHAPASEKLRAQAPVREIFIREIYFYDEIMPAYMKFQEERNIEAPFDSVAKCFATSSEIGQEVLMLDNLKTQEYECFDRRTTMNAEHVEFVFTQYGKLHAISYAMKDQNLEEYNKLTRDMADIMQKFFTKGNMLDMMTSIGENVKSLFKAESEKHLYDFYSTFNDKIVSLIKDYEKDEFATITHGDCWCNNMMFKYDNENKLKPSSMRLIDFQIVREVSPVFDLAYFFYVCVSKDIMDDIEKYLKIYHNSLSSRLRELGSDPDKILPFSELLAQWKKYAYWGLAMAGLVIRIMLSDSDEAPDLAKDADAGDDFAASFVFKSKHEDEYEKRIRDVVVHFYEKKFNDF